MKRQVREQGEKVFSCVLCSIFYGILRSFFLPTGGQLEGRPKQIFYSSTVTCLHVLEGLQSRLAHERGLTKSPSLSTVRK